MTAPVPARIARELRRDLAARRDAYPGRVATGRMPQEEADHRIALVAAWLEDVERADTPAGAATPARHGLSWRDRRAAAERELDARRAHYPDRVAKGRLAGEDAETRIACLAALLALYEDGFDWRSTSGEDPAWGNIAPTAAQSTARDEFRAMRAAVEARDAPDAAEPSLFGDDSAPPGAPLASTDIAA